MTVDEFMSDHPLEIDLEDYVSMIQGHTVIEPMDAARPFRLWQLDIPQHLLDCSLCRSKVLRLAWGGAYGGVSSRLQPETDTIEVCGVGEPPYALHKLARGI